MKIEDMILHAIECAAYCYAAADRFRDQADHRERFLSLAKKWEAMARNFERDIKTINESQALLLRVDAQHLRRRP
jgi:hypothetical protein